MRKLLTSFCFLLSFAFINAQPTVIKSKASDCVASSRSAVEAMAEEYGWDIHTGGNESDFAADLFTIIYEDCYLN